VSDLYNRVFTTSEERAVLDRLFNTFFKLPLAIAQQQKAAGRPPTLAQISEQFRFTVPGEADLMLRIMEADPRMPRFVERDPASGEITRVDVAAILADPSFGRLLERTIAGWEGRPAPAFSVTGFDGTPFGSADLAGKPHLVYFWFSGCPPCLRSAPLLAKLGARFRPAGFEIAALNADRVLEVPASDEERAAYARKLGPALRFAHASPEALLAYGSVSVFPSFFFVDRNGVIMKQLFNFQEERVLEDAVRRILE
jgi:thiol-disulfide isomerase/thioredoxin